MNDVSENLPVAVGESGLPAAIPVPDPLAAGGGPPEPEALPLSPKVTERLTARSNNGRFVHGNRAGRGNPLARQAGRLRTALYRTCTPDDLAAVLRQ